VENPSDIVKDGQQLEVMILKINPETHKISLGLKQVAPDPWTVVETRYGADSIVSGRVTRLTDFGAFVELEPGVEGLIPMSELSFERRIKHASSVVKEGDVVRLRILSVDLERKRISLSLKRVGDDPWTGALARWPVDSVVDGIVTRTTDFGAFVELTAGVEGMVHISELSDKHIKAVNQAVSEGQTVKAKVLAVDEERRRISLSLKALIVRAAPEPTAQPAKTAAGSATPAEAAKAAEAAKRKKPLKGGLEFPGGGMSLGNLLGQKPRE
jgi:small subunit ribosomal protein S1